MAASGGTATKPRIDSIDANAPHVFVQFGLETAVRRVWPEWRVWL